MHTSRPLSNWSMYRLLDLSSVNCLFVIDTIKYLYPELSERCPDDSKKKKLQEFYKQFSTIHSVHTCKNFEYVKERTFDWFINLDSKVNFMETCNSPSKGDVFQLCKKANKNFRILLKQLIEQYPCLNLENNFDRTKQLSLLRSFYWNMFELQNKKEFNIDKEIMSPFSWSDIEQLSQNSYQSNSRTLHPVSTVKEISLVSEDLQRQWTQLLPPDKTNKKTKKKQLNVKHSGSLNGQTSSQKCLAAKQQLLKNTSSTADAELLINSPNSLFNQNKTKNATVGILNEQTESEDIVVFQKISVNKSKNIIQKEIDRFVSQVCAKNKSMLLEINENQMNDESQNLDTPSTDDGSNQVNSENNEDFFVEIKKYEYLIQKTSNILAEKNMKIELLENNINKCRNKCKRLHKNLVRVKRLHLKQKAVASDFL